MASEVDIPALAAVAGVMDETASLLGAAQRAHGGQLTAGAGLVGWATEAVLSAGVDGWTAFLGSLRGEVQQFGDGLRASARDYQTADEAARDRTAGAYGRGPV